MIKQIAGLLFQLKEGLVFATKAILMNRVRTFLSLFGITIGIFSIISVFTTLDSLKNNISKNLDSFKSNVIYLEKWPWGPEEGTFEYKWWKYYNRPEPTIDEYYLVKKLSSLGEKSSFSVRFNRTVKYANEYTNATICGGTHDFSELQNIEIEKGRGFTPFESNNGSPVATIGVTVAEKLFGDTDPLGKKIKIGGIRATITGVAKRQGDGMFGDFVDNAVVIPIKLAQTITSLRHSQPLIMVEAKDGVSNDQLKDELVSIMRRIRRISPGGENNFATNQLSIVTGQLDRIFTTLNLAGGIIGIFAIIVGGFGIANIMFVSVRERMTQIGIQKALGAKSYVILWLFMYESVLLSVIGGIFGLALIYIGTFIVNNSTDFTVELTFKNIIMGLGISGFVGIISGFAPAYQAAKMEPVKAIFKI